MRVGEQVERYVVDAHLGDGGMAAVYRARHATLRDRVVALKVLHRHLARYQNVCSRFIQEAEIQTRLQSDNILQVLDILEWNDTAVLVLDYAAGGSLATAVQNGRTFTVAEISSIGEQALAALAIAHAAGVVHRDLKPDNLLLHRAEGPLRVLVSDFGIAKVADAARATGTGSLLGTVAYMSPEQLLDASRVDTRSDLYSLGVALWELIQGEQPYASQSWTNPMFPMHVVQVALGPLPPHVPLWLRAWVERLMARDIEERYQSAEQALADLALLRRAGRAAPTAVPLPAHPSAPDRPTNATPTVFEALPATPRFESLQPAANDDGPAGPLEPVLLAPPPRSPGRPASRSGTRLRRRNRIAAGLSVVAALASVAAIWLATGSGNRSPSSPVGPSHDSALAMNRATTTAQQHAQHTSATAAQAAARWALTIAEETRAQGMAAVPAGAFRTYAATPTGSESGVQTTLSRPFWLDTHEVTQGQWQAQMGANPSHFSQCGPNCPVENVNWFEAAAFANERSLALDLAPCYELSGCTGVAGTATPLVCDQVAVTASSVYACEGFRLPTDAEWVRAAMVDVDVLNWEATEGSGGPREHVRLNVGTRRNARFAGNSDVQYRGSQSCNTIRDAAGTGTGCGPSDAAGTASALGHHNLLGNVAEWTHDAPYPLAADQQDPERSAETAERTFRGGNWMNPDARVSPVYRWTAPASTRHMGLGFRLARTVPAALPH